MPASVLNSTHTGLIKRSSSAKSEGFDGSVNGCRYFSAISWGASCLQTDTNENQDGWCVSVLASENKQQGRVNRMQCRPPNEWISLLWSHETLSHAHVSGCVLNKPLGGITDISENRKPPPNNARLFADAVTFTVLDGHGVGGRHAAAAVEAATRTQLASFIKEGGESHRSLIVAMLQQVDQCLNRAQRDIERLNNLMEKDFGTTCVSVTLVNDVIISTACGDSSSLLVVLPHGETKTPLIVELGRRHHLTEQAEIARIKREQKGRIIIGDGGILRLIPAEMNYTLAKKSGLSINMARSLGHVLFKDRGLSSDVDFTFLTLGTLPRLMRETEQKSNISRAVYRLPPLTYSGCLELCDAYSNRGQRGNGVVSIPLSGNLGNTADKTCDVTHARSQSERARGLDMSHSTFKLWFNRKKSKKNGHLTRIPADIFILLLSDGVTDVFSSACLINMLRAQVQSGHIDVNQYANDVTAAARERRHKGGQRSDNCTCIAVHLSNS